MGRKKELTAEQREAIFYCRQRGDSYQKIADIVGCGKITVFDTLKRYAKTGSMKSKSRSGRSYLINNNQRKQFKRLVINDKAQNQRLYASGVKKLWKKKTEQEVSVNTIRRTLYSVGLNNHIARRKPLISSKNKAVRLAWSLKHESWSSEDWVKVLWSDESTFIQFQ